MAQRRVLHGFRGPEGTSEIRILTAALRPKTTRSTAQLLFRFLTHLYRPDKLFTSTTPFFNRFRHARQPRTYSTLCSPTCTQCFISYASKSSKIRPIGYINWSLINTRSAINCFCRFSILSLVSGTCSQRKSTTGKDAGHRPPKGKSTFTTLANASKLIRSVRATLSLHE